MNVWDNQDIGGDNTREVTIQTQNPGFPIKKQFSNTIIIVIGGDADQDVISKAFSYGAKDAFCKSYKRALMVERVKVLSGRMT